MENASKNILYSTHCPVCDLLESRLKEAKIPYELCSDVDKMRELGFKQLPMFYCADKDKIMKSQEALLWIINKGGLTT